MVAANFESGCQEFKAGVFLRQALVRADGHHTGRPRAPHQDQKVLHLRLENQAEDVRLSTIERVAAALGKNLVIQPVEA